MAFSADAAAGRIRRPNWQQLDGYTFEQYLQDYPMVLKNKEDYSYRKSLFKEELQRVQQHNLDSSQTWKAGINKFSALTKEEKLSSGGLLSTSSTRLERIRKPVSLQELQQTTRGAPSRPNLKEKKEEGNVRSLSSTSGSSTTNNLPSSVDWRNAGIISPVRDQGFCGSCYAFSSAEVVESFGALNTGLLYQLSPQQFVSCVNNTNHCGGVGGCNGGTNEVSFAYLMNSTGLFSDDQFSYVSYYTDVPTCGTVYPKSCPYSLCQPAITIQDYANIPENDYDAVMTALATIGPLGVVVDASDWSNYETGIFTGCNQTVSTLNHNVQLVGYGEENGQLYWIVRNSWGPSYGEGGYIRLPRSPNPTCATDPVPADGVGCTKDDDGGPISVCGACGILYDAVYVIGANTTTGQTYFDALPSTTCSSSNSNSSNTGLIAGISIFAILFGISAVAACFLYYTMMYGANKQVNMSKQNEL